MPSLIETLRWLTLIAWMVWFVGFWNGGRQIFGDIRKSIQKQDSQQDTSLMLVIVFLSLIIVATGFLITAGLPLVPSGINNAAIISMGIFLTLLGMGGTVYCRRYLGHFWTADTFMIPGFEIVEGGPYSRVRHPIATGAILMYTGTALVFPCWWNLISILLVILIYVHKTLDEDQFLEENLSGYADYKRRVPYRLFPKIW